jgi:CRP-like cAMP-binding protein
VSETLEAVPLFADLAPPELRRVAGLARVERFPAGSAILRLGDRGHTFHVILEGRALVVRATGRPLELTAGDFFGELALIEEAPRSADVIAAEDVSVLTIDRAAFTRLLRSEAALTYVILRTLVSRLRGDESSVDWELGNVPEPAG